MENIKYCLIYRKTIQWINNYFPVTLAKMRFRKLFGRSLNLKDPKDLNEKILWLSLFSDTTLWSQCADKYAVRDYVKGKGLEKILVKLYGKWDSVADIEWEKLPQKFVIKTNNGAGTVLIVSDKGGLNIPETNRLLEKWLSKDISSSTTEFHYRKIKPCIIAEELLELPEADRTVSSSMVDYKIWCFNGKPDSILVCSNRQANGGCALSVFDLEWNYHPEATIFNEEHFEAEILVQRPPCLDEMLHIASLLSLDFPEVRVDFYCINGKIYFGELTFTSLGGTMTYYTQQELLRMGKKIDISNVKKIKKSIL